MEQLSGAIAVFVGAASFGILSTFVKKAYALGFTLGEVTGIQALFGMIILWLLYIVLRIFQPSKLQKHPKLSNKWKIIAAGFSTGLVSILYYKCVQLVPASIAIVLLMQFIWISAILDLMLFKQKPSQRQLIGIITILVATVLATGILETPIAEINIVGIVYGLLAATAYAIFIVVNGKVGNDYPPIQKSALMVTGACILVFITLRPFKLLTLEIDYSIYNYGLLLAVFGTVLPPLLYSYGMPKTGVSLGSILSAVELPVAVCLSYFVLHEQVSLIQWIGVMVILAMVIWINLKKQKETV